jgi:peptide/nickel transport system permease protein
MVSFILRRFIQMIFVLIGASFMVFISVHLTPGDPAMVIGGEQATIEDLDNIRETLGLDKPIAVQYFEYMKGVLSGDLGISFHTDQSVASELFSRFPNTLALAILSLFFSIVIGIPIGIISAIKQNSWMDITGTTSALIGVSIPNFWMGAMLILVFSVNLHWFPVSGLVTPFFSFEGIRHLLLPSIAIGTASAALIARMTRSSMLEIVRSDYVRTARSKGVKEKKVIFVHSLRNAMIPVITIIGTEFGVLLGGAIITEQVFAINGIGRLIIDAILARDFPIVQGGVLFIAFIFVFVNFLVDVIYVLIDPRISYD